MSFLMKSDNDMKQLLFFIPTCRNNKGNGKDLPPKEIPMGAWLVFFGIWIAEGWAKTRFRKDRNSNEYSGCIAAHKERVRDAINEINDQLGFTLTLGHTNSGYYYKFSEKQVVVYMEKVWGTGATSKHLPKWCFKLNKEQSRLLLESMILGDGVPYSKTGALYYTSSKQLADDFQRLTLHAGWSCNVKKRYEKGSKYVFSDHSGIRTADGWVITLRKSIVEAGTREPRDKMVQYKGKIHCCEVSTGIFYVRRNGKGYWTGNSSRHGQPAAVEVNNFC